MVAGSVWPRLVLPLPLSSKPAPSSIAPWGKCTSSALCGRWHPGFSSAQPRPRVSFLIASAPGDQRSEADMNGACLTVNWSNGSERGPSCFIPDVPASL